MVAIPLGRMRSCLSCAERLQRAARERFGGVFTNLLSPRNSWQRYRTSRSCVSLQAAKVAAFPGASWLEGILKPFRSGLGGMMRFICVRMRLDLAVETGFKDGWKLQRQSMCRLKDDLLSTVAEQFINGPEVGLES